MAPQMSFDVEPERDLVRITLSGFFTPVDVRHFVAARDDAHRRLRCGPHAYLTLVDMRTMEIQAQETVTAFQGVLAAPQAASRRIPRSNSRSSTFRSDCGKRTCNSITAGLPPGVQLK